MKYSMLVENYQNPNILLKFQINPYNESKVITVEKIEKIPGYPVACLKVNRFQIANMLQYIYFFASIYIFINKRIIVKL